MKKDDYGKRWWKAAAVRAVKTMAQTAVAMLTVTKNITAVDWATVAETALLAGVISMIPFTPAGTTSTATVTRPRSGMRRGSTGSWTLGNTTERLWMI